MGIRIHELESLGAGPIMNLSLYTSALSSVFTMNTLVFIPKPGTGATRLGAGGRRPRPGPTLTRLTRALIPHLLSDGAHEVLMGQIAAISIGCTVLYCMLSVMRQCTVFVEVRGRQDDVHGTV